MKIIQVKSCLDCPLRTDKVCTHPQSNLLNVTLRNYGIHAKCPLRTPNAIHILEHIFSTESITHEDLALIGKELLNWRDPDEIVV